MPNASATRIAPPSATKPIDLDVAIADAHRQLGELTKRRRQLRGVIRSFAELKKRQMPSDLFEEKVG